MPETRILDAIAEYGVAPVVAIDTAEDALPLADALTAGGLPVVEIAFRTPAAAAAIDLLSRERPDILLGAGTVLTLEDLEAAKALGAQFAVAPGLNPAIVERARAIGLPFIPGVATPSDIERGLALGCAMLKFFPAGALGGPAFVKAMAGPFGHTGVRFMPTGGVNEDNLEAYLELPAVAACGGTWIATRDDVAAHRWDDIRQRCEAVYLIVENVRGRQPGD